jgi:CoA-transferase family III
MHERDRWLSSPPGAATAEAPPVVITECPGSGSGSGRSLGGAVLPFDGVRVLDLTRVIAGPVATKFLAGYGADILRIDPPGFEEVPSLLPETTIGKRTTALDLTAPADRATFEQLVAGADVLIAGLRADALPGLGYDDQTLTGLNPELIIASLDAYGWDGPWRDRRGFDSLVQMSCGIAADGAAARGQDEPGPLPVQALDHATGWLLGHMEPAVAKRRSEPAGQSETTRTSRRPGSPGRTAGSRRVHRRAGQSRGAVLQVRSPGGLGRARRRRAPPPGHDPPSPSSSGQSITRRLPQRLAARP